MPTVRYWHTKLGIHAVRRKQFSWSLLDTVSLVSTGIHCELGRFSQAEKFKVTVSEMSPFVSVFIEPNKDAGAW